MTKNKPSTTAVKDNRPLEFFCHSTNSAAPVDGNWALLRAESKATPFKAFTCKHRDGMKELFAHTPTGTACDKIRKARPNPLIGNCSVRKTDAKGNNKDWIVCPSRFLEEGIIFKNCREMLNGDGKLHVFKELKIGNEGNADFVTALLDDENKIVDFVALEIQACGTGASGSIWDARNDYLDGTLRKDYNFSLNEKDASKKILVQLLHKARQVARWRKNTVLVIQDLFLEHLNKAYNLEAHFHKADSQDFVHIHSYKLVEEKGLFKLRLDKKLSTDLVGLSMALISNPSQTYYPLTKMEAALEKRLSEKQVTSFD